jgi:hypothetical protein
VLRLMCALSRYVSDSDLYVGSYPHQQQCLPPDSHPLSCHSVLLLLLLLLLLDNAGQLCLGLAA